MSFIKKFNTRSFVSLTIFLSFSVILITSVLMFINKHQTSIALLHTIIGFGLLLIGFWHLKNNFSPLKNHFRWRFGRDKTSTKNMALPVAVFLFTCLVVLSLNQFAPLLAVYEWGNTLRAQDAGAQRTEIVYQKLDKELANHQGPKISIDLRTGPYFLWPQYAIWAETIEGEFIQPIYVTSALAKNNFVNKVTKKDNSLVFDTNLMFSNKVKPSEVFNFSVDEATKDQRIRPESLPVFLHKLGKETVDGYFVPTEGELLIDAYTGATMLDSFLLATRLKDTGFDKVKIRFEINHSFDFNEYYSSDRFPNDEIYSGNGYSAQPSIIYEAVIDLSSDATKYFPMALIGQGHHSGQNGEINTDVSKLTTALELVDRIIVEVE
ncbi:DUF4405 domain-containing protein [Shewanella sp. UCD-KL12]|uniref:DUF4405 domain-containing protein n=1 Tax=Shewanella sp. UCD-KL12 TaxID=1917163 RepID=UPI000970E6B0|nr:DUF4405 domain-containing protein [Shewanella sp. UCD-KL12]